MVSLFDISHVSSSVFSWLFLLPFVDWFLTVCVTFDQSRVCAYHRGFIVDLLAGLDCLVVALHPGLFSVTVSVDIFVSVDKRFLPVQWCHYLSV